MGNFFEKLFGKKKQETVSNNLNQQNNLSEQGINNQNTIQPEQAITFNQNMNVENQMVNPLGFQPMTSTDNIQNTLNSQEYNLNPQPIQNNNQTLAPQAPMMNTSPQQELNVIPQTQTIQNEIPTPQPIVTSNEVNNVSAPQPITFNQEPQQQLQPETLNVIPTLGPTPNPTVPNQNNINNQNM